MRERLDGLEADVAALADQESTPIPADDRVALGRSTADLTGPTGAEVSFGVTDGVYPHGL